MAKTILLTFVSLIGFINISLAHGIKVEYSFDDSLVIVKSSYSHKSNLANALVKIYSPLESEKVWQSGKTDKNGLFVFMPDVEGGWIFIVDDQKGHKQKTTINYQAQTLNSEDVSEIENKTEIEETKAVETAEVKEQTNSGLSNLHKIIIGLSLIFGISGVFYGIKSGKN